MIFVRNKFIINCSAISAVDPIGVLTIFDTIGIHKDIYYILFGESVLNGKLHFLLISCFYYFEYFH